MHGAMWVLEISGDHFVKYVIFNHYAAHLKPIQNNIEIKKLKKKKLKSNSK